MALYPAEAAAAVYRHPRRSFAATVGSAYLSNTGGFRDTVHRGARNTLNLAYQGTDYARRAMSSARRAVTAANLASRRRRPIGRVRIHNGTYRNSRRGGRRKPPRRRFRNRKGGRKGKSYSKIMWNKLCTPMTYKSTMGAAQSGTQGLRTFACVDLGGATLIKLLGARHPSNFLFNTAQGSSSTATLQDQGGTNWQMQISALVHDMRIQNRSNASMELTVYECVIRHDVGSSAFSTGGITAETLFQDSTDVPTFIGQNESNLGPSQAALPTGMTHNWQHPTFTPFNSNEFVNYFKILRTKKLVLSPNEIVPMKFACKKKRIKGQQINSTLDLEWQKGWNKYILFSWVGMPVDDGSTANLTKAKCDLFYQDDLYVKYHFLPGDEPLVNFDYTNTWNTTGSGYNFNPAAFGVVIPASDTVQVQAGDTAAAAVP